jgi:hypothetical protein
MERADRTNSIGGRELPTALMRHGSWMRPRRSVLSVNSISTVPASESASLALQTNGKGTMRSLMAITMPRISLEGNTILGHPPVAGDVAMSISWMQESSQKINQSRKQRVDDLCYLVARAVPRTAKSPSLCCHQFMNRVR